MGTDATNPRPKSVAHRFYSWLIELWIAAVLIGFFIVRVLGSGLGQRLLSHFGIHRTP
jgi:hypothetical protein